MLKRLTDFLVMLYYCQITRVKLHAALGDDACAMRASRDEYTGALKDAKASPAEYTL